MFKTIFTVTKKTCGSTDFTVFFEDFDKAKEFAEKESKKLVKDYFVHNYKKHLDGSFSYYWMDLYHEIWLDDSAWVTGWRVNGIGFYHSGGILSEFETYEDLQKYFLRSQELVS